MTEIPLALVFLVLLVVLLLVLVQWVFMKLRRIDSALFDKLGRPDLFMNNNLPNVITFWKWVYGGSLRYAGDGGVSAALWAIRLGTIAYGIGLILFLVLQMSSGA